MLCEFCFIIHSSGHWLMNAICEINLWFTFRCLRIFNWDWRKYFNMENKNIFVHSNHIVHC